jgi:DNA-binding NtrC family response regulator
MAKILVIDDNRTLLGGISEALLQEGHEVFTCENGAGASKLIEGHEFSVVVTDLKLPDASGLDLLEKVKSKNVNTAVLVMTAYGTVDTAVQAMKMGALDFLTKPFPADEIVVKIRKALDQRALKNELLTLKSQAELLRGEMKHFYDPEGIIGESPQMSAIKREIEQLAASSAAVLILGETGTGKELIARAIHYRSPRSRGPFIRANCAAFAETLLESELFGHEKGAFTGAHARKLGRFELADKGTIFLDEIAELSISAQAKLLRVLQEHEFERVGGTEVIRVDVRLVAATNRDLEEQVKIGEFREDLYYRLNVVPVHLPPLRERKMDIPVLVDFFLKRYCEQNHKRIRGFTPEAEKALMQYDWPGNIRELENMVERGVVLSKGEWIEVSSLPFYGKLKAEDGAKPGSFTEKVAGYERKLIADAMASCDNNISKAAELLSLSRSTLRYKLKKYGL